MLLKEFRSKKTRDPRLIADDVSRTLVAFVKADGGELFVGVEDDGIVTGIPHSERDIAYLLNVPKTHIHSNTPLPTTNALEMNYSGKKILYFSVPKGTEYVYLTSDGRCLQRKDRDSYLISSEEILFSRDEKSSREYDRQFVENAKISDLIRESGEPCS